MLGLIEEKMLQHILDSEKLIERLCYLKDRWSDEKEYENWGDYEKEMKKIFDTLLEGAFLCGTKRPFGFKFSPKAINKVYHLTLKQNSKYYWLAVKF